MRLDVANQVVDELSRLLPADALFLGITVADVAKVGAIEGQIDVFGEAADRAERLGKRRAAIEDPDGRVTSLKAETPLQGPAHPDIIFNDRVADPSPLPELGRTQCRRTECQQDTP